MALPPASRVSISEMLGSHRVDVVVRAHFCKPVAEASNCSLVLIFSLPLALSPAGLSTAH